MARNWNVTRRKLVLNPRDTGTGWWTKAYESTTIEMPIIPRSASAIATACGTYVRLDAVGFTLDPIAVGDQILDGGTFYEVEAVKDYKVNKCFWYREAQLRELPMEGI